MGFLKHNKKKIDFIEQGRQYEHSKSFQRHRKKPGHSRNHGNRHTQTDRSGKHIWTDCIIQSSVRTDIRQYHNQTSDLHRKHNQTDHIIRALLIQKYFFL